MLYTTRYCKQLNIHFTIFIKTSISKLKKQEIHLTSCESFGKSEHVQFNTVVVTK